MTHTTFPATCTSCGEFWEHEDGRGPTGPCRNAETGLHAFPVDDAAPAALLAELAAVQAESDAATAYDAARHARLSALTLRVRSYDNA